MNPDTLVQILNLIAAAAPGIVSIVSIFQHKDGSVTVVNYVDAAQAEAQATMTKILAWQVAHQVKTV